LERRRIPKKHANKNPYPKPEPQNWQAMSELLHAFFFMLSLTVHGTTIHALSSFAYIVCSLGVMFPGRLDNHFCNRAWQTES
jgi:hypothetical protein